MTTDPYRVLGVSPTADDAEIKDAYKKLVKQYHPDRYQDEEMKRLANEKMADINTAYDRITDERRNGSGAYGAGMSRGFGGGRQGDGYGYRGGSGHAYGNRRPGGSYSGNAGNGYGYAGRERYGAYGDPRYANADINYAGVRSMINSGRINEADNVLNTVSERGRTAEWYYLKGLVYQQRGWLNDAYHSIAQATRMDSGNKEYLGALQQMNRQRTGFMSGNAKPAADDNADCFNVMCNMCCICCEPNCCECFC